MFQIPAMSQAKDAVVSDFSGLGTLETKHDDMRNYGLLVVNEVIATKSKFMFHIIVSNFSDHPRQLLNKTVLLCISPNPLTW